MEISMRIIIAAFGFFAASSAVVAQPSGVDLTYWQDIRPIFRKHCTACHSARNLREIDVSGGLALDSFDAVKKGAKQSVLSPGHAEKSALYDLLVTKDKKKRMPLDSDPLSKEKIALVKKWIDSGAKEGTPPVEVATPASKKSATRKLDVAIATTAIPPAGAFGVKAAGKLDLAMKIGPLAPITAVAFNPSSTLLAVGSYGQVAVWDLVKGVPVKVLTNVLGAVNDLRFSPKGDLLAVGGGQPSAKGDLRLYQTADWKLIATLRGHDDVVFSLAFSPDGARLASASFDHSVRLWDVKAQATVKEYHHHSDFVYAVAFSPDGKKLVSASKDRTVQLFDVESGKSVFTFSGMDQDVMAVAFHPNGKSIISSGFEAAIYWWNAENGEKIKAQGGHGVATHEVAFSKDGKRVVSAGADRTIRTWDGTAGTVVKIMSVGSVTYAVAISPDGKRLASGSFDGLVRIWDEVSGRHLVTLLAIASDAEQPDWLAITPEGFAHGSDKLLAAAQWRVAGQAAASVPAWALLRQPSHVAGALRSDILPVPMFDKK